MCVSGSWYKPTPRLNTWRTSESLSLRIRESDRIARWWITLPTVPARDNAKRRTRRRVSLEYSPGGRYEQASQPVSPTRAPARLHTVRYRVVCYYSIPFTHWGMEWCNRLNLGDSNGKGNGVQGSSQIGGET